jgi:hypothetical protein
LERVAGRTEPRAFRKQPDATVADEVIEMTMLFAPVHGQASLVAALDRALDDGDHLGRQGDGHSLDLGHGCPPADFARILYHTFLH